VPVPAAFPVPLASLCAANCFPEWTFKDEDVQLMCLPAMFAEFYELERRHNYTTPKTFLELIKLYKNTLLRKRKQTQVSITTGHSVLIFFQHAALLSFKRTKPCPCCV
jgi:hypothetical protein